MEVEESQISEVSQTKKIASDVPLGKIKNDKQRNTFINQKETENSDTKISKKKCKNKDQLGGQV